MRNNYNRFEKNMNIENKAMKETAVKPAYSFYSNVLQKPFETVEALREAEAAHFEAQRAKEAKAASKKSDATKVEEAFKALNAARKAYKDDLMALTASYAESLKKLKAGFENDKSAIHDRLAKAEAAYELALREFNTKYPEGYHLTLKDGDFETTIHSARSGDLTKAADLFDLLFRL